MSFRDVFNSLFPSGRAWGNFILLVSAIIASFSPNLAPEPKVFLLFWSWYCFNEWVKETEKEGKVAGDGGA